MIYDFTKVSAEGALRLADTLANDLSDVLRRVATNYIVTSWADIALVDTCPILITLRVRCQGKESAASIQIPIGDTADSEQLGAMVLEAFGRFKMKRRNEIGVSR